MAKYNIYAVAYGLDPKTQQPVNNLKFHKWDECKPYVVGVEGAKYKGFLTEAEADTWLAQTAATPFEKNVTTLQPAKHEEVSGKTHVAQAHHDESFFDPEFYKMCTDMGVIPMGMVMMLQKQFVAQQKSIKTMQDSFKALQSGLPFI